MPADFGKSTAPTCFYHWTRGDVVTKKPTSEYPYESYNIKLESLLGHEFADDDWTKEDTRELIIACEKYESRWPIIIDRIRSSSSIPLNR
ncbi:MAG: SANT/Myb-like domain of [Actinomycetota bacterium]|jgi:hypothetical protein